MKRNLFYEKRKYKDRVKEIFTLFLFTIVIAVISLVAMDILILPISIFAINQKSVFNYIIKDVLIAAVFTIIVILFLRKIYRLYKDGNSLKDIFKYLLLKPLSLFGSFLIIMLLTFIIIFLLYIILNFNNDQIYQFTNS